MSYRPPSTTPPWKGLFQNAFEGGGVWMFTPPPIDNAATEKITPKRVRRGRRVDFTLPHIDNVTAGRIYPPMRGV